MQRQRSGWDNDGGRGQCAAVTESCKEKTQRSFSEVISGDLSPPQRKEESAERRVRKRRRKRERQNREHKLESMTKEAKIVGGGAKFGI